MRMMESLLWFNRAECRSCGQTGCCSVGDFNGIDLDTCFQKKRKCSYSFACECHHLEG